MMDLLVAENNTVGLRARWVMMKSARTGGGFGRNAETGRGVPISWNRGGRQIGMPLGLGMKGEKRVTWPDTIPGHLFTVGSTANNTQTDHLALKESPSYRNLHLNKEGRKGSRELLDWETQWTCRLRGVLCYML